MQTKIANECFINEPIALFYDTLGLESVRTRTAWAVFKYCGTKTVPLRIKK